MPARVSIDRERIVEAALDIVREGGWESVSARSIAARLGSSTMPIYSGIGSMEELRNLVRKRATALLEASQRTPRTQDPTLDLALGYVVFAREEPRLFRFAITPAGRGGRRREEDAKARAPEEPVTDRPAADALEDREDVANLLATIADRIGREDFILRSWFFTHGLAELIAVGAVRMNDAEIVRHLQAAGAAFYITRNGWGGE